MTAALRTLVAAVEAALADPTLGDDRARTAAFRRAMAALLDDPEPLPAWAHAPLPGPSGPMAVGNLVHADDRDRFHVLAVVFPEGTSSGVHRHGCWGLIGYLRGSDEETRYRRTGGADGYADLEETSRHVWHRGDITALLPPDDGWHRVRNPGPGDAVSVHVLCRSPATHPHDLWRRDDGRILPFPFVELSPGRWAAHVIDE
ncbi:hypothetical protein BH24ACT3_BH24ACT3_04550 [soil metagenome]